MKVEEIQIGDWVQNPLGWRAQVRGIRRVQAITDEFEWRVTIGLNDDTFANLSLGEIEPIPLTPEILEKNGFRYTNQHTLKGADTYVLCLEQRGFDFSITIKLNDYFALDSYDDRMYRLVEIQTGKWYVHDLQHALRLVGIEHEIKI